MIFIYNNWTQKQQQCPSHLERAYSLWLLCLQYCYFLVSLIPKCLSDNICVSFPLVLRIFWLRQLKEGRVTKKIHIVPDVLSPSYVLSHFKSNKKLFLQPRGLFMIWPHIHTNSHLSSFNHCWPLCCSWNILGMCPPQDLCTGLSRCQELSSLTQP